jgi:hypothetical protein
MVQASYKSSLTYGNIQAVNLHTGDTKDTKVQQRVLNPIKAWLETYRRRVGDRICLTQNQT